MGLIRKFRALLRRDRYAAELDEELRYHLAMREQLNRTEGVPDHEASIAAKRSFGNVTLLKESAREADLPVFVETILKDIHFACRMLAKNPGFTALGVLALGVGIGINTAVFTACKAILLQPLDAKNPDQLVNVYAINTKGQYGQSFSYPDFEFYRDHNDVFSGLIATIGGELEMNAGDGIASATDTGEGGLAHAFGFRLPTAIHGGSEFVSIAAVSENYFAVLGVNAVRGRVFLPQDAGDLDEHPAILISDNFWRRRFAADTAVLGKTVKLSGAAFTIIGITPRDFVGTIINVPNIWLPMRLWPLASKNATVFQDRESGCCALYGRLNPAIPLQQAQSAMTLLATRVRSLHPPDSDGRQIKAIALTPGSHVGPLNLFASRDSGLALALLLIMGAVGLVLLIACANLSSLQLARSAARQKEIGVRLSLGASRARIVRQLLTESSLLGILAGGVSLFLTWWTLRLLMLGIASSLPTEWGSLALHVEPDSHVFAYVFAISLFAGILFGLAPALQTSRPNLASALKEEGSGLSLRISNSLLRDFLLAIQAAASLFLLIGAGLLIRGSLRSMSQSPGYETKRVICLDLYFPRESGYTHAKQIAEITQLLQQIRNMPGVDSVAVGRPPDGGGLRTAAVGLNGNKPATDRSARTVFYTYTTSNYFNALGIPLVSGRAFSGQSAQLDPHVVISQSVATEFWPGENPIGKKLALDASNQFHVDGQLMPAGAVFEVVGIAADTRAITPQGDDNRQVYLSLPPDRINNTSLLVRFEGGRQTLAPELARQLREVDPNLIVYTTTLEDLLTSTPTFVITRLAAIFASLIGGLGLLLACVGIYGTVGYAVTRRRREVGIRMALGARGPDVLRLIIFESGRSVAFGLLAGIAAAAGASRILHSFLFGLSAVDPISFAGVGALFLFIALLAAYVPARRATRIDPLVTLRCD